MELTEYCDEKRCGLKKVKEGKNDGVDDGIKYLVGDLMMINKRIPMSIFSW